MRSKAIVVLTVILVLGSALAFRAAPMTAAQATPTENVGAEPATIWIAALTAADEPLTQFHEAATTP